jgi:hypothetical protein
LIDKCIEFYYNILTLVVISLTGGNMKKQPKVVSRAVSMYPAQWDAVSVVENQQHCNTSQALRYIVEEYKRLKSQLPLPLESAQ